MAGFISSQSGGRRNPSTGVADGDTEGLGMGVRVAERVTEGFTVAVAEGVSARVGGNGVGGASARNSDEEHAAARRVKTIKRIE